MSWTKEELKKTIKRDFKNYKMIVVSNREPYVHNLVEGKVICQRPAGGTVSALDPVMRACGGIWIAYSSGNADRSVVDKEGKVMVPPELPGYTLKRLWLTKEQKDGYYYGFSNKALWPLCHNAYKRPEFNKDEWEIYDEVNRVFARAVLEEIGRDKAFVWIQDYHLATTAKYIKAKRPDVICALFWHIPWPSAESFRICPPKKEILNGLLSNDMLGFQVRYYLENFISTVETEIEARVDRERTSIIHHGHETVIRAFPVGVDFEYISKEVDSPQTEEDMRQLREELSLSPQMKVFLGLDRIDYTKGIPERLQGIDQFLNKYPQYKERFVFVQMGALSRIHIAQYRDLNDQINTLVERINWRHSTDGWQPIILIRKTLPFSRLLAFYKMSDVCIVSSLQDGMNMVAKEYIAAKNDLAGMVLLSHFTGAARELYGALMINPYDVNDIADKLKQAMEMPDGERKTRLNKLREIVAENNIYKWAGKFILELPKTVKALRKS